MLNVSRTGLGFQIHPPQQVVEAGIVVQNRDIVLQICLIYITHHIVSCESLRKPIMTRSRGDFQLTFGLTPEVGRRRSFFCSAASRHSRLSWASKGSRNIG